MQSIAKRTSTSIVAMMVASLVFQPFAALAATDLTDVPLIVQSRAKPNILFTLDNSGSMEWGSITGTDATAEFSKSRRAYYSPTFNELYYNPTITYLPGVKYDSTAPTIRDWSRFVVMVVLRWRVNVEIVRPASRNPGGDGRITR